MVEDGCYMLRAACKVVGGGACLLVSRDMVLMLLAFKDVLNDGLHVFLAYGMRGALILRRRKRDGMWECRWCRWRKAPSS